MMRLKWRGSPPPMRGKVRSRKYRAADFRITPAYAGKSIFRKFHDFSQQDHPRLCGEKCPSVGSPLYQTGSPPPMRGKAKEESCEKTDAGITPAYAGKSLGACACTEIIQDHPRLCGEKSSGGFGIGSSQGITPAYAGKSWYRV